MMPVVTIVNRRNWHGLECLRQGTTAILINLPTTLMMLGIFTLMLSFQSVKHQQLAIYYHAVIICYPCRQTHIHARTVYSTGRTLSGLTRYNRYSSVAAGCRTPNDNSCVPRVKVAVSTVRTSSSIVLCHIMEMRATGMAHLLASLCCC